jgi:Flp pilus assembly protein TadG
MIAAIARRCRALLRDKRGANAVEVAILVVPTVLLLFGVLEFGRLQWTRNAVEEVAAAGARCVGLNAVSCSDNGDPRVYNAAKSTAFMTTEATRWSVVVAAADINVTTSTTCQGLANFVQVTVNHQFRSGLLAIAGLSNFPISSVACYPSQS